MFELPHTLSQLLFSLFTSGSLLTPLPDAPLPLQHAIPGGLVVLDTGLYGERPDLQFNGMPVMMQRTQPQAEWQAIIGLPLTQPAGKIQLQLGSQQRLIEVADFAYQEQHLQVKKKHVDLSEANLQRVLAEQKQIKQAFRHFSASQSSFQPLRWPLAGPLTSPFGKKRFFNGKPRKPHSGLDIAAPTGTRIYAPAAGKVILTGDFFFNGNSVFIDHGQGLITMYCHLNTITVKTGDNLQTGGVLGEVGASGRATGPHLHWSASLNNARINPLLLLDPRLLTAQPAP